MTPDPEFIELSEEEIAFSLEIILRADTSAIPLLRGKGAPRDCDRRDAMVRIFAQHLAGKLRQHVRCFRTKRQQLHSTSGSDSR